MEESLSLIVRISPHRIASADVARRHKTTNRNLYDREYTSAHEQGFDEVLFLNERGELVEGAISNLFLQIEGGLITPPLSSGALPGVLRRHILATARHAEERILTLDNLRSAEAIFLGNSVRGLRRIERIESDSGITIYRAAPPLG
jgi:para-aminobenzoate synthetase/4-amino-4-deoxychorismate lyase